MYTYTFSSDRDFRRNVDRDVRDVLRLLAAGKNTTEISSTTGMDVKSVRTIKANATRGVYQPNVVAYVND